MEINNKFKKIQIVDAIMGSGKTTGMFNKIASGDIKLPILYISPYLQEVGSNSEEGRIQKSLPDCEFISPKASSLNSKSSNIEELIKEGSNVACTHNLMQLLTETAIEHLRKHEYTVIIDEAIDAFGTIEISPSDLQNLQDLSFITIDAMSQLHWDDIRPYEGKFNDIRNACKRGSVFLSSNSRLLMWEFPVALFSSQEIEVWVMTYPFNGTFMKSFFDIHNIKYELVADDVLGLKSEKEIIDEVSRNLDIYEGKNNDFFKSKTSLSSSNLDSKAVRTALSKSMRNVATTSWGASAENLLWTTFKKGVPEVAPIGFKSRHVACNLRATNEYADCSHVMYGVNVFANPEIVKHITARGGSFDKDAYALGEMLQLLWRGCMRKGEPMKVFVPSLRMRNLLRNWLAKYDDVVLAA